MPTDGTQAILNSVRTLLHIATEACEEAETILMVLGDPADAARLETIRGDIRWVVEALPR